MPKSGIAILEEHNKLEPPNIGMHRIWPPIRWEDEVEALADAEEFEIDDDREERKSQESRGK